MTFLLEFEFPWYSTFIVSMPIIAIVFGILKSCLKMTNLRYLAAGVTVIFILTLLSSFFSFSKLSKINKLISEGKILTLNTQVNKVSNYHGQDILYVGNESFYIKHKQELYCVSGKRLVSEGDKISLSYVKLGGVWFFGYGNCIVELVNHTVSGSDDVASEY